MSTNINFNNRKVGDILADIRANSTSERDKGTHFERLFCKIAPLIPELEIKDTWLWAEWPELGRHSLLGIDDGIDLVAKLNGGELVAIQCKCYAENHKVDKADITKFIAGAKPKIFPLRWFITTTDYTETANEAIKAHDIHIIDFRQYLDVELTGKPAQKFKPKPLQQKAINAVIDGFVTHNNERGRLIMACGTGKTFTVLRIAEKLNLNNILFIAPSIALVAQARREWLRQTKRPLACTVICSDPTTKQNDGEDISVSEISCRVTTDAEKIAAELKATPTDPNAVRVVFCTYQSLPKLHAAQHKHGAPAFDIAFIDEAHRTTGYLSEFNNPGLFQLIHDKDGIRADKRLYMTATPRIYDVSRKPKEDQAKIVDMNNEEIYGKEFHRLTFKEAVEAGMLCDYRVVALGVTEDTMDSDLRQTLIQLNDDVGGRGKAADEQAFLALGAIALSINGIVNKGQNQPGVLARTIAYASNIRRSKWLARALKQETLKSWVAKRPDRQSLAIHAQHLDGTSSTAQRNSALRLLKEDASEEKPHLITNAKLFTEGVDVPMLNAIAFLDPRQSQVDTIQAVGRVMRLAKGKTLGYIIVPVILPPDQDLLEVLDTDRSRFKSLGNVLRALQSHDGRLYTQLTDRLTFPIYKPTERETQVAECIPPEDYQPGQLSLDLEENAKQAIYAQIAKNTGIAQRGKIMADAITQAIEQAARIFKRESVTKTIADTIGTPGDNEDESCKTAALLIANACIMHKRLEETGNLGGLTSIEEAIRADNRNKVLLQAWRNILQKDYAPIFEDATALLEALPERKTIDSAIGVLTQCAIDNATTLNELGFDHAGPLYHRVLGTAKNDGAFYTKNLSAYLLAGLAFDKNFINWADEEEVNNLRIIDPACGTGTLLMAALNIIKKRVAQAQDLNPPPPRKCYTSAWWKMRFTVLTSTNTAYSWRRVISPSAYRGPIMSASTCILWHMAP